MIVDRLNENVQRVIFKACIVRFEIQIYSEKFRWLFEQNNFLQGWLTDLNIGALKTCYGNHIKASCSFMAFNVDASGIANCYSMYTVHQPVV